MIDKSVEGFFTKNAADGYAAAYDRDHGPRLDAMIAKWDLRESLKGRRVVDVGGGLGFLGKRLDPTTEYWVIDGAIVKPEQRLCSGTWGMADLDRDEFSNGQYRLTKNSGWRALEMKPFDAAFCLETLEHLTNPYHCLSEIKKLVKPDGDIYISIPHENVWHNAIYPALLWPPQNWEQFLGQMSLQIEDRWMWDRGWNARHWKCKNGSWDRKVMLYEKTEEKFRHATPVEMVNL